MAALRPSISGHWVEAIEQICSGNELALNARLAHSIKSFLAADRLHLAALDLVITSIEHAAKFGHFIHVTGHGTARPVPTMVMMIWLEPPETFQSHVAGIGDVYATSCLDRQVPMRRS